MRTAVLSPIPPAPWRGAVPRSSEQVRALWRTDREYRVWSVLRNNMPAVRANMAMGKKEADAITLYRLILMMDAAEFDAALNVPWEFGKDQRQDDAFSEWYEMRADSEGELGPQAKLLPLIGASLIGLATYFQQSRNNDDLQAASAMAAQMQAEEEARKAEQRRKWEATKKWLVPLLIAIAVIVVLLLIKHYRGA